MSIKKTCIIILVIVGFYGISYGEESLDNIKNPFNLAFEPGAVVGVGAMMPIRPYKGMDNDVYVVPILMLEYKYFFIDKSVFGYYFNEKGNGLRFGIIGAPHFGGYDSDDSRALRGMDDRDWGFDLGLRMEWENDYFDLAVDAMADISGTYKGQEVDLTVSKVLFNGFLTPRMGVSWQSKDLVDYYYGVERKEAMPGRNYYTPDADFEYVLGLMVSMPLGDKWALIGDVQCSFLGNEVQDSPIIDEDNVLRYTLGMVYRF